jgi:hypothetical protein
MIAMPFMAIHFKRKLCVDTLFPARESLVSDIPDGTGKSLSFFYSVQLVFNFVKFAPTATFFPLHSQKSLWVSCLGPLLFSSLTPPSPLHSTLFCLSVSLFVFSTSACLSWDGIWFMMILSPPPPPPKLTVSASPALVYLFVINCMVQITNILWRPTFHVVQFLILLWRDFIYVKIPEWEGNKSASRLYVYAPKVE